MNTPIATREPTPGAPAPATASRRTTAGVQQFFEAESDRFDSIYGGGRTLTERAIDRLFHRVIRLRFERTLAILDPIAGKRILDVGCGPGRYALELARRNAREVVGVDFAPGMLAIAQAAAGRAGVAERVRFVAGDFLAADLDGTFDGAVAIGYCEYLTDPVSHLARMRELVRGDIVVSFPKRYTLRTLPRAVRYRLRGCYLRFFTAGQIRQLAAAAGLTTIAVHSVSRDYLLHARDAHDIRDIRDVRDARPR
jgi:cyclopropane fatty-acyl-phospholipid synthase-like methyltransferase